VSSDDEAHSVYSTPEFLRRSVSPRTYAARVRVSPTTVHKWLEEGMPSALIGARRLIHVDTADFWLKERLGIKDRQGVLL
jgi:hypothetical protein